MSTPPQPFEDLIRLLDEEATIYGSLADLLESERTALHGMAVSEIGQIASSKETLALRIRALDESRKVLSDRLARQFAIPPSELTISALCSLAPGAVGPRLDKSRLKLREAALRCKQRNDDNARAARCGLDLIRGTVEHLISEGDPAGKVYQRKGPVRAYSGGRPSSIVSHQA